MRIPYYFNESQYSTNHPNSCLKNLTKCVIKHLKVSNTHTQVHTHLCIRDIENVTSTTVSVTCLVCNNQ